ncbi:MAG: FHA domain-containing protein [Bdellovibrionaceae bacterium]|nr:FHA domain-containing protein [Pseudobdellovibrionaceae bacterium]
MAKSIQVFIVTIQQGEEVEYKIVDDSSFTVGRSLDATIAFGDPDISRIHLIVTLKHDRIWIEDQGSANGTFVNDQKIPAQKTVSVEPGDKVKVGKSEIYLSFNLLEKCFKKDEIVKSQLPKDEKDGLLRLIQGAHAEAQKIVKLAQDSHDKLIKIAENKSAGIENATLLKQDEILQNASMQSQQIIQDAKRKGVGVINEAQEDAQKKVQEIYEKANGYKKEADDYYKNKIEEAQSDAERVLKENENLSNKIVEEAREKVTVMREFAQRELDQFKNKSLLEIEELKKTILNDAEKEKELLLQRTDREAQKKVQALIKETEENNKIEHDKMILNAKTEIEQIKKDSASDIDRLKQEISALQLDVKRYTIEVKDLEEEKKLLVLRYEKEEIERRKTFEDELKAKEDAVEKQLAEKRTDFEDRLKKRQELAEKDISARYMDLEVEEERKNKELAEFHSGLKKKEEDFFAKLNKDREFKLKELDEREKNLADYEAKIKKDTNDWVTDTRTKNEKEWADREAAVRKFEKDKNEEVTAFERMVKERTLAWESELRAKTTNWETETRTKNEKEWADRELELRNLESQKRVELQKWIESEQAKRETDWKDREQKLASAESNKERELAAWAKEKQDEFFSKNKNLVEENGLLETRIAELKTVFGKLSTDHESLKAENEKTKTDTQMLSSQLVDLKKEVNLLIQNKDQLILDSKSYEKRVGEMKFEIDNHANKLDGLKKEFEGQKAQHRSQVEMEKTQMTKDMYDQVNQLKLLELDKLKGLKEDLLSELHKTKERLSKEIHQQVEKSLVGSIPVEKLNALSNVVLERIQATLAEQTAHIAINSNDDANQFNADTKTVLKKQKRERFQQMVMGFVIGAVCIGVLQATYLKVSNNLNPVNDLIAEQAEVAKKDMEAKKFNPKREPEVKDSYVDLVLYTDQFYEMYLSPDFNERFGKATMEYLLRTWRIEEEKSIQVVAMSKTLVKTLLEKKDSVRTDFLEQGMQKLKETESETEAKIVEILGSQVKYESYRKFERKYFRDELEKFYLSRNATPEEGSIEQSSEHK